MKDLEVSKVLESIELTDEQQEAMDSALKQIEERIKSEVVESYQEELKSLQDENEELKKQFDESDGLYTPENVEKAFQLAVEDAEAEKQQVYETGKKAAELMVEDLKEEYTKMMAEGIQEIYETVEERVKADIEESKEIKALEKIKTVLKDINNEEDLVAEAELLRKEVADLKGERETLSRDNIIDTLTSDLPEDYKEDVRNFIQGGKTENEIYERFNSFMDLIEKKLNSSKETKKTVTEDEDSNNEDKDIYAEDMTGSGDEEEFEDDEFEDDPDVITEDEKKSDDENWLDYISLVGQAV